MTFTSIEKMIFFFIFQAYLKDYLITFVRLLLGVDQAVGSGHLSCVRYIVNHLLYSCMFCIFKNKTCTKSFISLLCFISVDENYKGGPMDTNLWSPLSETLLNNLWNSHRNLQDNHSAAKCLGQCWIEQSRQHCKLSRVVFLRLQYLWQVDSMGFS